MTPPVLWEGPLSASPREATLAQCGLNVTHLKCPRGPGLGFVLTVPQECDEEWLHFFTGCSLSKV